MSLEGQKLSRQRGAWGPIDALQPTRLGLQGDSGSPTGALHPVRLSVSPAPLYRYIPVAHAIAARSLLALGSKKQRCFREGRVAS